MRGGFLIAADRGLLHRAAAGVVALGGAQAIDDDGDGVVQLAGAGGRLFTLYERVPDGTEWEVHDGPFTAAPGVQLPDMQLVTACPFDCRWPDLAVRVANAIARTAEASTWVLDGDGVIWDAETVDPTRVRL